MHGLRQRLPQGRALLRFRQALGPAARPDRTHWRGGRQVVSGHRQPALDLAARYDADVLCERFIPGRELTVALLDGEPLPAVEIIPSHEIYDYECKYTPGMSRYEVPARLDPDQAAGIAELAVRAGVALRQECYSRIDFRRHATDGSLWCLEANSLPGLTATSLVPKAANAAGIGFPELCERIALAALERSSASGGRWPDRG